MKISVLDHGYVEFIEAWGSGSDGNCDSEGHNDYEKGIIEAARQSTAGSFRGWERGLCTCDASILITKTGDHDPACPYIISPGDAKLLKYLFLNNHNSPFEFAGLVIEVQAPIMVFREWHRHRTQSYNEMSARYVPLPDLYYTPTKANLMERAEAAWQSSNKQAKGTVEPDSLKLCHWLMDLDRFYEHAEAYYKQALADGVPKELARLSMPLGHYTRMRASANLRNWLSFLTLRMDHRAQWEIRQYANALHQIMGEMFPRTMKLFQEPIL